MSICYSSNNYYQSLYISPEIMKRMTVKRTYVEHKELKGHMRALSKDTKNKNGLNPDLVIVDEWHEHPTRFIVDTCLSAFGKKPQNLMIIITTAGVDAENNVCKIEEESICKPILQGIIEDESYFVIIREVDEKDDPHDFNNLTKANPMLQVENNYSKELLTTITKEHNLAFNSAIPEKVREYKTKRLNWWVEDSDEKYFDSALMKRFKSLAIKPDEFKRLIKGSQSWNGGDLSKCDDLTASAFVHDIGDGKIALSSMGFIPKGAIARHEKTDRVPYRSWCEDEYCTETDGEVTDIAHLENWTVNFHKENGLQCQESANDSYNALQYMNNMEARGYVPIEVRQGKYSLSEATKLFRNLVREGKVVHDGNKCFEWCLSNAYFEQDSNENIKLSKKHAKDTQRIDLVAAMINALTRYIAHQSKPSVYESRGARII